MKYKMTAKPESRLVYLTIILLFITFFIIINGITTYSLSSSTAIGLLAFLLLAISAEGFPLQVPFGNAYISLSGTIFWAVIVIFDPYWAAICGFSALLLSELIIKKKQIIKVFFNASQTSISIYIASYLFHLVFRENGIQASIPFLLSFILAALVHWILNTWLVSLGAALLYKDNIYRFWDKNFKWAFIYEITSTPVALALAYAYQELWVIGILLVSLPILMLRLAYSQYIELKKTYRETVRTLVKIIEMHDPYTAGHSDRVAMYSRRLCDALRLPPGTAEKIELAAYLHDLGKINLDLTKIVRKQGKLTEDERRLIKLHSVVSADLANQVSYFRGEIESMIRHHHENWDGTGYPHGLRGEEIPIGARIILLADAFDAMTTNRVYRGALDLESVKNEFRKFAGSQFDPQLVPIFIKEVIGDGADIVKRPISELLEKHRDKDIARNEIAVVGTS